MMSNEFPSEKLLKNVKHPLEVHIIHSLLALVLIERMNVVASLQDVTWVDHFIIRNV